MVSSLQNGSDRNGHVLNETQRLENGSTATSKYPLVSEIIIVNFNFIFY